MLDIASSLSTWLNSASQGAHELGNAENIKISSDASTEVVKAVAKGPVGFIRKPGGIKISMSIYVEKAPDVDWDKIMKLQETISLTFEIEGGKQFQIPHLRVSTLDMDADSEGKLMRSLELVGLAIEDI